MEDVQKEFEDDWYDQTEALWNERERLKERIIEIEKELGIYESEWAKLGRYILYGLFLLFLLWLEKACYPRLTPGDF